jgi:hypothetical protein
MSAAVEWVCDQELFDCLEVLVALALNSAANSTSRESRRAGLERGRFVKDEICC